jgi:hypothetical protein
MPPHSSRPGLFLAPEAHQLLNRICREAAVDPGTIEALIRLQQGHAGKLRRRGLSAELEQIIDQSLAERKPL